MRLTSYKAIAEFLGTIWERTPSAQAVHQWSKAEVDPLPVNRVFVGGTRTRGMVSANPAKVEAWARRQARFG